MDTELYCKSLENLEKTQAIQAIHEAYLQLSALDREYGHIHFSNKPALDSLKKCLKMAGHIGFID